MTWDCTRRTLIGSAATVATLAVSGALPARAAEPGNLVLVHRRFRELGEQRGAMAGSILVHLEGDVVRHWRAGLRDAVRANGSATAYVPWAEAMILADLAREERGRAAINTIAADSAFGHGFSVSLQLP